MFGKFIMLTLLSWVFMFMILPWVMLFAFVYLLAVNL